MGNRAPEDLGIGHPWELNVARVNRLTGDLFYTVDPVRIFPGNVITLRRFHQWKLRCGRRGAFGAVVDGATSESSDCLFRESIDCSTDNENPFRNPTYAD